MNPSVSKRPTLGGPDWMLTVLRVALGMTFVVSGFQKLVSPTANFAATIEKFQIVSGPISSLIAHTLPWVEYVGGVLLVIGLWTPLALAVGWLMNVVFIGVLGSALARKIPIEQCGCFGEGLHVPPQVMLTIDLAIWVCFLVLYAGRKRRVFSLDALFPDR